MKNTNRDDLVTMTSATAGEQGERIPMPSDPVLAAQRAIVESDPRTAGRSNRPAYLVARVLRDAKVVR